MVRGIVIPAVAFYSIEEREFAGLQDDQDAVQGCVEPITICEPALTLYVDEDGRARRMSLNERATALWWLFSPHMRGNDLVVGTAVVVPEDQSASEALLRQLQRDRGFRVQAQISEAMGEWVAGERQFPTWFEAARFALARSERFSFVAAIRVSSD